MAETKRILILFFFFQQHDLLDQNWALARGYNNMRYYFFLSEVSNYKHGQPLHLHRRIYSIWVFSHKLHFQDSLKRDSTLINLIIHEYNSSQTTILLCRNDLCGNRALSFKTKWKKTIITVACWINQLLLNDFHGKLFGKTERFLKFNLILVFCIWFSSQDWAIIYNTGTKFHPLSIILYTARTFTYNYL